MREYGSTDTGSVVACVSAARLVLSFAVFENFAAFAIPVSGNDEVEDGGHMRGHLDIDRLPAPRLAGDRAPGQ